VKFEDFLATFRRADLAGMLDMLALLREQAGRRTLDLDAQIATLEAEKRERVGWMAEATETLEQRIKEACLAQECSVKGAQSGLQVVFARGRVTWETDKLEGYAAEHPELLKYRKTGTPSAKIL